MNQLELKQHFQTILTAYEQHVLDLPLKKRGHFYQRAYAVTGDERYSNGVAEYLYIETQNELKSALRILSSDSIRYTKRLTARQRNQERLIRRHAYFKQVPEAVFYSDLAFNLFLLKKYKLHQSFLKPDFDTALKYLRQVNVRKTYLNEEAVCAGSSYTINALYSFRELGLPSHTTAGLNILRHAYFRDGVALRQLISDSEYTALIYSLTHIIINDSRFYARYVRGHRWILDYFSENAAEIIERTVFDIIIEVALCFALCQEQQRYRPALAMLLPHIMKHAEVLQGPTSTKHLVEDEHSNSLLLLFCSGMKHLHRPPNLSTHPIFRRQK